MPWRVAVVLPAREGFSPGAVGAIGLQVAALAGAQDVIVGPPPAGLPCCPAMNTAPSSPACGPGQPQPALCRGRPACRGQHRPRRGGGA
ncbi:hypothetical protein RAA17_06440 [Komagataeibacter rhaeticus]|nr:hypothetical protein [Komagataeibacter rhaeticus]